MGFSERIKKMLEETEKLQKEMQQEQEQEQEQGQEKVPTIGNDEKTPEGCEMYDTLSEAAKKFLQENKKGRTVIVLANDKEAPQSLTLVAGNGKNIIEALAQLAFHKQTGPLFDHVAEMKSSICDSDDDSLEEKMKAVDNLVKVLKKLQEIKL